MTDLERVKWENDPEAFIILRLQESSDPDAAHKAFQAHLKEDAKNTGWLAVKAAELAMVEETNDRLVRELDEAQNELTALREAVRARLRQLIEEKE